MGEEGSLRKVARWQQKGKICNNHVTFSTYADGMGSPISKEMFLQRACARFAEHYDYSQIVYKSYKTPIQIRCSLHPVKLISITPEKHLQTSGGCKYCLRESRIRMLERELHREPALREESLPLSPQAPEPAEIPTAPVPLSPSPSAEISGAKFWD
jgi:hypothetical protein